MTTETKDFPTADVLGAITGRLLGDIGGIYNVLGWMADESVFTHQLPRLGREAVPAVLAIHPELQAAMDEAEQVTPDNWRDWLTAWTNRYGSAISVPRFTATQHRKVNPITEAANMVGPDRVIVV